MRRTALAIATVAVALASGAPIAHAGPWTPEPGHGYWKLWLKWLPELGYIDGQGDRHDYGPYHEVALSTYGELGLTDGVAAWLHAPLVNTFTLGDPRTGETSTHLHPGDPAAGLRWRSLQHGRFVAALEGGMRVPIAPSDPVQTVYGDADGNPEIGRLRVGSGVFDVHAGTSSGYSWDRWAIASSIAYVLRTGGYDDVLTWTFECSHRFGDPFSMRLRLTGWHPILRGTEPRDESPSGIGNGTSYTGFALEAEHRIADDWSVGATFEGGIFDIRRQTGGPVLSLFVAATP
jgi:hypothetical protein